MKISTKNSNPNFTIVLPGPCQANCDFCFWNREKDETAFIKSIKRVLKETYLLILLKLVLAEENLLYHLLLIKQWS